MNDKISLQTQTVSAKIISYDLSLEITTNDAMDEFLDNGGACGVSLVARTNCSAGGQNPCIAI